MITTTASSTSAQPSGTGLSEGEKVGITALVIIVILLAVITILVAVFVVQRKSWKKQTRAANSGNNTHSNLVYDSKLGSIRSPKSCPFGGIVYPLLNFFTGRTPVVILANSNTFDSVSYTDVPDEIADRPVPEYDEIIDQERVHSKANSPAKVQAVSNRYCSTGSESQENNHDCTIVSLVSVYQVFSQ